MIDQNGTSLLRRRSADDPIGTEALRQLPAAPEFNCSSQPPSALLRTRQAGGCYDSTRCESRAAQQEVELFRARLRDRQDAAQAFDERVLDRGDLEVGLGEHARDDECQLARRCSLEVRRELEHSLLVVLIGGERRDWRLGSLGQLEQELADREEQFDLLAALGAIDVDDELRELEDRLCIRCLEGHDVDHAERIPELGDPAHANTVARFARRVQRPRYIPDAMTRAIIVLGMHRSGTSCLAGMLAAGGLASAGEAVRNWDNARGHHEMLDAVRLNEAVLAYSGGHWLSAPPAVRWTPEHAAERDRLLRTQIDGKPALVKDPRTLLALPFWRASTVPFHVIGIVRHPLAVARSLESWRATALVEGIALWSAHNRVLALDHAHHGYTVIDFGRTKGEVVAAVLAACADLGPVDAVALADAYEEQLVHHDTADSPVVPGLAAAVALHHRLGGAGSAGLRPNFPRGDIALFTELLHTGAVEAALQPARAALRAVVDASAVLVPVVTSLVKHRAFGEARVLIAEQAPRLDPGLADLLHGKVLLAIGDATAAVRHLEAACGVARPLFQARHLLPQALRQAGRHADARVALQRVAGEALYAHGPLATLAEWSWLDGDPAAALAEMARAIAAAPPHRRGRLRTRRAEWLVAQGDPVAARAELVQAIDEDPGYGRSREILASMV